MTIETFQERYGENAPSLETLATVAEAATSVAELEYVAAQFLNAKSLLEQHLHSFGIRWEQQ